MFDVIIYVKLFNTSSLNLDISDQVQEIEWCLEQTDWKCQVQVKCSARPSIIDRNFPSPTASDS